MEALRGMTSYPSSDNPTRTRDEIDGVKVRICPTPQVIPLFLQSRLVEVTTGHWFRLRCRLDAAGSVSTGTVLELRLRDSQTTNDLRS
jgi:hypothetical protein